MQVWSVKYNKEGNQVVSVSDDKSVNIYSIPVWNTRCKENSSISLCKVKSGIFHSKFNYRASASNLFLWVTTNWSTSIQYLCDLHNFNTIWTIGCFTKKKTNLMIFFWISSKQPKNSQGRGDGGGVLRFGSFDQTVQHICWATRSCLIVIRYLVWHNLFVVMWAKILIQLYVYTQRAYNEVRLWRGKDRVNEHWTAKNSWLD